MRTLLYLAHGCHRHIVAVKNSEIIRIYVSFVCYI